MTSLPLLKMVLLPEPGRPSRSLCSTSDDAQRADAMAGLGLPAFRAKQLANHYFAHLTTNPDDMTDLPAASREATALAPSPRS